MCIRMHAHMHASDSEEPSKSSKLACVSTKWKQDGNWAISQIVGNIQQAHKPTYVCIQGNCSLGMRLGRLYAFN